MQPWQGRFSSLFLSPLGKKISLENWVTFLFHWTHTYFRLGDRHHITLGFSRAKFPIQNTTSAQSCLSPDHSSVFVGFLISASRSENAVVYSLCLNCGMWASLEVYLCDLCIKKIVHFLQIFHFDPGICTEVCVRKKCLKD